MNNVKRIMVLAILLGTTVIYGQRRPDRDKIKSLKVAFITERLNLSSSEAQAFWPIYNAHEEKMESLRRAEGSELRRKLRNPDELSDSEAEKLLDRLIEVEEEKIQERKSFLSKLKKVISSKKIVLLIKTEEDFKKRLIQQYRKNRGGGGYR